MRTRTRALETTTWVVVAALLLIHDGIRDIHAQNPALSWDGLLEHITAPEPYLQQTAPNGSSQLLRHSISDDGRYVLFTSDATNLANGGYNPPGVTYLRDRDTGHTQDFSFPGFSDPAISGDGSQVAFRMCNQYWRPDTAPICDVWVFNWQTWTFSPMSVALDGTYGNADSSQPVISTTGRYVVFKTNASNLLPPGAAPGQLVIRDRDADGNGIFDEPGTEVMEVVSAADGSLTPGNDVSDAANVSDDGRYVAFRSMASNLVPLDTNGGWDVFQRDRLTHETRLLARRPTGQPSPVTVDRPEISMSADGRYVAFASADRYLVAGFPDDVDNAEDVFVYDRETQALSRIDLSDGVASVNDVDQPMLSSDGRYVAMRASSQNSAVPWGGLATAVFVYDRMTGLSTKVSVLPGGGDLNWHAQSPAISGDGTVVLFTSRASNVAPGLDYQFDKIFAAVHFEVQPAEVVVPGSGGRGTFTITTQPHTQWSVNMDWSQGWFTNDSPPFANLGSGVFIVNATMPNPSPTPRSVSIAIGPRTVTFTEGAGLSLTSVSPSAGPLAGGTMLTLRGTGFEPGMLMSTNWGVTPAEFVDNTTLRAPTPPGVNPGLSYVGVQTSDGRFAWIGDAFRYLDNTPPMVFPSVDDIPNQNGWYRNNVTVTWLVWDGESAVTSTSGCAPVVISTDTPGTTLTCSATSEGGTNSASITIKRDATPPNVVITQPKAGGRYVAGQIVPAAYTCADATSGIDSCVGYVAIGDPIDTTYGGFDHQFVVGTTDQAGNFGGAMATYDVAWDTCVGLDPRGRAWWRMEGDTTDLNGGLVATGHNLASGFLPAIEGQGFAFPDRTSGFLEVPPSQRLDFDSAMTIALWIKPQSSVPGVLLEHPSQYRLQRLGDGSIQWTFFENDGGSISAIVPNAAPPDAWTHLVITFDGGVVKTYVNGQLVRTDSRPGTLQPPAGVTGLTIGGQNQPGADMPFVGGLDELQLVDYALPEWQIGQIYLSHGVCVPEATTLAVNVPAFVDYGTTSFFAGVVLMDSNGQGIPARPLTLSSGAATIALVTDANGLVSWNAPANFGQAGTYQNAFSVVFDGDAQYQRSSVSRDITVQKLTPSVTWPSPADITYGTPLGASQLDATANVPGTFAYAPQTGTVLGGGAQTLSVTFHPSDAANYNDVTTRVALTVQKAVPGMNITGGSVTYDGQPHPALTSATDYLGQPLTPLTITYNGSSVVPVSAGTYNAVASFAGDSNHLPRSVSATIAIGKATPTVTWSAPGPVVYGTPLGAQLSATANVPGTFTYTPPAGTRLPAGTGIALSANFVPSDSTNYVTATANRSIDVLRAPLTISAVNTSKVFGAPLPAFTAVASGFVSGDSMASLAGSLAFSTTATATSPVGSYPVTPSGLTSGNYAITFVAGTLSVTQAGSTVTAASNVSPSGFNQAVTFNASVSITAPGAGTPTGTIEFRDGSTRLGTVPLTNGTASLTTNGLSAASHTISAIYSGDANVASSTRSFTHVVLASAQSSTTAVSSSSNPATAGANVTLTATVSAPSGLSGTVAFYDGSSIIGTATLSATKAKLVISTLANGTHAITARYSGNATIPPSTSPVFAQVVKLSGVTLRNSTATVVASPSPSALDQTVTLTATVAGNESTPPTGAVVFFVDGFVVSGAVTLSPSGTAASRATLTTSTLAHGVHNVEVAYLGDGTYKGDSGTTTLTVN